MGRGRQGERARPRGAHLLRTREGVADVNLGHMASPAALACLHICTEKEKRLRGAGGQQQHRVHHSSHVDRQSTRQTDRQK